MCTFFIPASRLHLPLPPLLLRCRPQQPIMRSAAWQSFLAAEHACHSNNSKICHCAPASLLLCSLCLCFTAGPPQFIMRSTACSNRVHFDVQYMLCFPFYLVPLSNGFQCGCKNPKKGSWILLPTAARLQLAVCQSHHRICHRLTVYMSLADTVYVWTQWKL